MLTLMPVELPRRIEQIAVMSSPEASYVILMLACAEYLHGKRAVIGIFVDPFAVIQLLQPRQPVSSAALPDSADDVLSVGDSLALPQAAKVSISTTIKIKLMFFHDYLHHLFSVQVIPTHS